MPPHMRGQLSLFRSHLQPGVLLKDGSVDTTRLELHVVQFSKAAHQVRSAPIDSVLRGGPRKKEKGNRLPVFLSRDPDSGELTITKYVNKEKHKKAFFSFCMLYRNPIPLFFF